MKKFLKTALITPKVHLGDPAANKTEIINYMKLASSKGAGLIVFAPYCITGSSCSFVGYNDLIIRHSNMALSEIIAASKYIDAYIVISYIDKQNDHFCKERAVIKNGEVIGMDDFVIDEYDISVCLSTSAISDNNKRYDIIISLFELDEQIGFFNNVKSHLQYVSYMLNSAYICVTPGFGESTTDKVFTGLKSAAQSGEMLGSATADEKEMLFVKLDLNKLAMHENAEKKPYKVKDLEKLKNITGDSKMPYIPSGKNLNEHLDRALFLQARGLATRLEAINCKKVIVGVSGGLDSTLALIVCKEAFKMLDYDKDGIIGVSIPCFGTTKKTKSYAKKLIDELGVSYREINIEDTVRSHFKDIKHDPDNKNTAYENSQARERTQVLMDLANDIGAIVVGTGDMSELALGWCTYGGDQMSMYGVNAGVPKTLIRLIVGRYASTSKNKKLKKLLKKILELPISPELIPSDKDEISQKTEDALGPYILHDFFLYYTVTRLMEPKELYKKALEMFEGEYKPEEIKRTLRIFYQRFFSNQYKRSCMPDGPQIIEFSLSPRCGFTFPSDISSKLYIEEVDKL